MAAVEVEIQSLGPAILAPGEALGNIVQKANSLLSDHRTWLSNLNSSPSPIPSTPTTASPQATITPAPSLQNRAPAPFPIPQVPTELCNCTPGIVSASSSAASLASIAFSATISSISSAAASAAAGIASAQASANSAIGVANASASNASASLVAATNSARSLSSSLAAATNSASSAISSASSAVASANSVVSSVSMQLAAAQVSASVANALASEAKATATMAIAQALATVSSVNSQASLSIQASRIQAMNNTRFALVITFSILGSSLISILIFYLILRTRRRRRRREELEYLDKKLQISYPQYIERRSRSMRRSDDTGHTTGSDEDRERILAEFPLPVNASSWVRPRSASNPPPRNPARERDGEQRRTVVGNGLDGNPYRDPYRDREKEGFEGRRERRESEPARVMEGRTRARGNTLTYDPERPDQPPRFRSWWEENGGDMSEKRTSMGMGMSRGRQRESLRPRVRESVRGEGDNGGRQSGRPEMENVNTGLGINTGGIYDSNQRERGNGNGNGNNRASEIGRNLVERVVGRKSQIGTAF